MAASPSPPPASGSASSISTRRRSPRRPKPPACVEHRRQRLDGGFAIWPGLPLTWRRLDRRLPSMTVINEIAAFHDEMTAWRRDLHAHPETAFEEKRTADIV